MMHAALGRWEVARTRIHLVRVLWWLNRQVDLTYVAAKTEHPMVGLLAAAGSIARVDAYDVPSMPWIAGERSISC
jgi:hypothetical protein